MVPNLYTIISRAPAPPSTGDLSPYHECLPVGPHVLACMHLYLLFAFLTPAPNLLLILGPLNRPVAVGLNSTHVFLYAGFLYCCLREATYVLTDSSEAGKQVGPVPCLPFFAFGAGEHLLIRVLQKSAAYRLNLGSDELRKTLRNTH